MLIHYTIQGIKKGHKKYKECQAEKERKLDEERGQLPDIQDPSRELNTTCLVEAESGPNPISTDLDRANSTNSDSTADALSALEKDPEFQRYMERHKQLYLEKQGQQGSLPGSDRTVQEMPASKYDPLTATVTHSSGNIAELPASLDVGLKPVEIGTKHISDAQQPVEADSTPVVFELPGNLPAIMPEAMSSHGTKSKG